MCSCVRHRHGSDPALLWLWYRLAAAALIRPLAWELPYATGVALKKKGGGQMMLALHNETPCSCKKEQCYNTDEPWKRSDV